MLLLSHQDILRTIHQIRLDEIRFDYTLLSDDGNSFRANQGFQTI